MLDSLSRHMPPGVLWKRPFGGLFIWLELPEGMTADTLLPLAIQTRVAFSPGSTMFVEKRPNCFLRLNFTVHEPTVIDEGIQRLAQAIRIMGRR
jgi:2-aminoadipate transaminase